MQGCGLGRPSRQSQRAWNTALPKAVSKRFTIEVAGMRKLSGYGAQSNSLIAVASGCFPLEIACKKPSIHVSVLDRYFVVRLMYENCCDDPSHARL